MTDTDDWHTGKSTKKQVTGQIPCSCKPFCQQPLTQLFFWDGGEELTKKKPEFKATENKIQHTTKFSFFEKIDSFALNEDFL